MFAYIYIYIYILYKHFLAIVSIIIFLLFHHKINNNNYNKIFFLYSLFAIIHINTNI